MAHLSPSPGVLQTADKAKVATLVTTIGGIITFLIAYFPDNDNVQLWGGLLAGIITILANGYGVFATPNKPK